METIGSRLRKRRRTDSSPTDELPPAPKRPSPNKTTSPNKRTQDSATFNTDSQQEPMPHGANSPSDERSKGGPRRSEIDKQEITLTTLEDQEHATQDPGAAEISDTVDRSETLDDGHASQGNDNLDKIDTESFSHLGASLHLKTQSLPILDNLVSLYLERYGILA